MKRLTLVIAASLALFTVAPAHAVLDQQFGLEAGTSLPTSNFADAANTGYNLGLVYQANLVGFGFGGQLKYNGWSASEEMNAMAEGSFGAGSEYKFESWQYGVFGTYSLPIPTMVKPYARLGLDAYTSSLKLSSPMGDGSESDTKFGMSAGIGADFGAPGMPFKFGVNTMYHRLKDSGTDFYSVNVRAMWSLKVGP